MEKFQKPTAIKGYLYLLILAWFLPACTPQWLFQHKEGARYTSETKIEQVEPFERVLKAEDKFNLSVWGHDEVGIGSTFSVLGSTLESGKYLTIDSNGDVALPLVGIVKLGGLTEREANLYLKQVFGKFLQEPIIYLRILSHEFTIMGEVRNPGNYPIDRQQKGIMEAIGDANGFTDYADKAEIRIIRKTADNRIEEIPIDLTDMETLYSTKLLVKSNDIIYIPERRGKKFDQVGGRVAPFLGVLSGVALLVSLLSKN